MFAIAAIQRLREKPETARCNESWTPEERAALRVMFKDGRDVKEIALELKRTEGGIRRHMRKIILEESEQGVSKEALATDFGLSIDKVEKIVDKKDGARGKTAPKPARSKYSKEEIRILAHLKDSDDLNFLVEGQKIIKCRLNELLSSDPDPAPTCPPPDPTPTCPPSVDESEN
jgi:hypothetical protein